MDTGWQQGAKEIHERYLKLARAKGRLATEDEVIRFLVLAICGESGELANLVTKLWRGDKADAALLREELADIRIYLEHLARHLGVDLDEACVAKVKVVEARLEVKEREAGDPE
jgi:NTP pyrophosphatase (non-canonical NTP hydrolase)